MADAGDAAAATAGGDGAADGGAAASDLTDTQLGSDTDVSRKQQGGRKAAAAAAAAEAGSSKGRKKRAAPASTEGEGTGAGREQGAHTNLQPYCWPSAFQITGTATLQGCGPQQRPSAYPCLGWVHV
jgi:hypothetical protein